jgi:hypothetical protein
MGGSGIVEAGGTWRYVFPSASLVTGDEVKIFLTDANSNINPATTTNYHDRKDDKAFVKALTLTVEDVPLVNFRFTNVRAEDVNSPLGGSEFRLYRCANTNSSHSHAALVTDAVVSGGDCWNTYESCISDTSGLVAFDALENGKYMLVETMVGENYEKPFGQWLITIDNEEEEPLIILAKGEWSPPAFIKNGTGLGATYKLPNMKQLEMPHAGGGSGLALRIIGMVSLIMALLIKTKEKRKKVC